MTKEDMRKYFSIVEDYDGDKINPSYYYCQIYADKCQTIELDCFCIRQNDVEDINNFNEIEDFVLNYVKNCLNIE